VQSLETTAVGRRQDMVQEFDLFTTIDRLAKEHRRANGSGPTTVSVSPNAYRSLVEFKAQAHAIGNLVICCYPLKALMTSQRRVLRIILDEILPDTKVVVG
jgi:hypothetical protein